MPTIDWGEVFARCARAAMEGLGPYDQALVVFDGIPPAVPSWLLESRATLMSTGRRAGPAAARNLAAQGAQGEILVFVDADVELHQDALERLRAHFVTDPDLTAVFGSYDDRPAADALVSRFRNLLHHHTHTSHPGAATTFWAGCGAVRRQPFLALGGFDARAYTRPAIEDIEFGLRLSDAGGRIELDPAIQGTHHKRWSFGQMVRTDINQRAIPWSRLLWQRRELPATLNLSPASRFSGIASLLLFIALAAALAIPALGGWALALAGGCLGLLLLLNRAFYALLLRRCGPLEALVGVGLHAFYLAYSSLTLGLVTGDQILRQPLRTPPWLKARPALGKTLIVIGLSLLTLLTLVALHQGLMRAWRLPAKEYDLYERLAEWQLFDQGIYPSSALATFEQQQIPYFRDTVYLPWALPLFGPLFFWGGRAQGTWMIQALSLASLLLIAGIGWRSLRRWGFLAGWLGALAPLAIVGNGQALAMGQFSILCMGLIGLQWLLLLRRRPVPAGLCWGLAMVKPQIAATFALPFLARGRWRGLGVGLALLGALSTFALIHTQVGPVAYGLSWLKLLPVFMGGSNPNVASGLVDLVTMTPAPLLLLLGALGIAAIGVVGFWGRRYFGALGAKTSKAFQAQPLVLAGLCGVIGQLFLYHRSYDNLVLFPALLVALRLLLIRPRILELLLAVLMALSLWAPPRLLAILLNNTLAQTMIWALMGVVLLRKILVARPAAYG